MNAWLAYERRKESAVLLGQPGAFVTAREFPLSNVLMAPDRYSYEGNWLFCVFSHPEVLAARIGFGRGRVDWRDYGMDSTPATENALFWRVEVLTRDGIYAHFASSSNAGQTVTIASDRMDVRFDEDGKQLIHLSGWPDSRWVFENPGGTLRVDLTARMQGMLVWPDCVMPRNTFGMCLGPAQLTGTLRIADREFSVTGDGIYDHPRILVQENGAAPFGWYLYSPVRFENGMQLACYYSEDGPGQRDSAYSAGSLLSGMDGRAWWFGDCQVRNLKLDGDGLPLQWETVLYGEGSEVSFGVKIRQLPLLQGWGEADPAKGKYVAYPLFMEVEGDARIQGERIPLQAGQGIAEFLVRKGLQPKFP